MSNENVLLDGTSQIIYSLRDMGLSHTAIARELRKQGIVLTRLQVKKKCKYIYELLGKEEPQDEKTNILQQRIIELYGEEIIEERNKGASYEAIANRLKEKGERVSAGTISKVCKSLFKKIGEKEPRAKSNKSNNTLQQRIIELYGEEIIEERNKGTSYELIANILRKNNERVSATTISKVCKILFRNIGKEEPKIKTLQQRIIELYGDEINNLSENGYSCGSITRYLRDKNGVRVSEGTIRQVLEILSCSQDIGSSNISELSELDQRLVNAIKKREQTRELFGRYRELISGSENREKTGEQK